MEYVSFNISEFSPNGILNALFLIIWVFYVFIEQQTVGTEVLGQTQTRDVAITWSAP